MTAKRDKDTRSVVQDSFAELQAHLIASRGAAKPPPEPEAAVGERMKSLEEAVADLARQAGFEAQSVLGIGGMGAVVRAVDTRLNRTVALKFLPPELITDETRARKLRAEAEIASSINHPNIVQILSWHEINKVPFYAMEYVEGENADELVRRRGRLPLTEALRIVLEAANGLEALHRADIIHRDIKPENILISRDGRVKITDFGISRHTEDIQREVQEGKIAGSPRFMSPEQARGEAATGHSDIYSLGAVLYFLLTGHAPIRNSPDLRVLIQNVRENKVVPITEYLPKLHRDIARMVMRYLNANPARRTFSIETFRNELSQALLQQETDAQPFVFELVRMSGRPLRYVATLAVGIGLGFFGGYELTQTATPPPPSIDGTILQLGKAKAAQLARLIPGESERGELERLLDELNPAVEAGNVGRIAELLPSADRLVQLADLRRLLAAYAADPRSSLSGTAAAVLVVLATGTPAEIDLAITDWNLAYNAFVAEQARAPQPIPAPPPPEVIIPPAGATATPRPMPTPPTPGR